MEKTSLKALGLRIQLGHVVGEECPFPLTTRADDFIVIDVDVIHPVGLDYCGCGKTADPEYVQLLKYRLYPATVDNPQTAFTFRALEYFHALTLQSKVSAYDFYKAIEARADAPALEDLKVESFSLQCCVHTDL